MYFNRFFVFSNHEKTLGGKILKCQLETLKLPAAPLNQDFRFSPISGGKSARWCGSNQNRRFR
jgi:hypothetical protein